jgi:hypothetical protein
MSLVLFLNLLPLWYHSLLFPFSACINKHGTPNILGQMCWFG